MSAASLVFSTSAASQIRRLPPLVKVGVRRAIDEIKNNPYIGKPLRDELETLRSHRFKRYRVVYRFEESQARAEIVFVGYRANVYDLLAAAVRGQKQD